ncbi:hypothetical protein [Palleronia pelagia]|uniref:Uncharacterized protein n=1 Tax=Palleronia pelagia TaxID=387096 RepID=A0A1H8ARD1_9RHOB|nr:hypothetical protein [Palleronia pelagia]SEM72067.1 hypothetical protein SAMN04488011_101232 [Palleronia pelagia]
MSQLFDHGPRTPSIRHVLGTLAILSSLGATATDATADERKTLISGAIHFYDGQGNLVRPYPWSADAVIEGLKARAVNSFQQSEIQRPLALTSRERQDELLGMAVAEYTVDTSDTLELPTIVRVSFAADVWSGTLEYPLIEHLGRVDKEHLRVTRMFDSNRSQVRRIRAVIDADPQPLDSYRDAYDWTVALTNTPQGDAGSDNAEDFMLLVELVARMVEHPGAMDQRIAEDIASIDLNREFEALGGIDRYRVLSELGFVLARAPNLDQPIYTDYTFYDLARASFDRAIDLALSEGLLTRRLASIHQERYKMSCEYGLIDQAKFLDCISDIYDFMTFEPDLSILSKRVGLSDFEKYLYQVSRAPAGQGLGPATRERIICDPNLNFFWSMFAETVNASGSQPLVRTSHLGSAYDFSSQLGQCQVEG